MWLVDQPSESLIMPTPQGGILPESNQHALFLSLDLAPGDESVAAVRRLLARLPAMTDEIAASDADAGLVSVVGIGPGVWALLTEAPRPRQLADYRPRYDGARKAPATPTDLFVHIRSERQDLNFELGRRLLAEAQDAVRVRDEVSGFRYLDSRDLTGFVDGTENPEGDERADVALVGDEDPLAAGGSYVLVMRFVHDLARWGQLTQHEQEQVIGRTKDTDEELDDAIRPESAHISRVVIEEDGKELEILRHSMPYGTTEEHGLLFLAYSARREIFDLMLDSEFAGAGEGVHDRLMDYTSARTGAYYFAPSLEALAKLEA